MKILRQVRYFFEWVYDAWICPVIGPFLPMPSFKDSAKGDQGQTLDDD